MPRKPNVPSISDKPTARTKPVKAKAAPNPRPPEQFDLWGALADFGGAGEATEAALPVRHRAGLAIGVHQPFNRIGEGSRDFMRGIYCELISLTESDYLARFLPNHDGASLR